MVDAEPVQRLLEAPGRPPEREVAPTEAADDRARPLEEGVGVPGDRAVVDARSAEAVARRQEQREPAAHAEADHADPSGAVLARGQPGADRVDVVERRTLAGPQVGEGGPHAPELGAPREQ